MTVVSVGAVEDGRVLLFEFIEKLFDRRVLLGLFMGILDWQGTIICGGSSWALDEDVLRLNFYFSPVCIHTIERN